MAAREAVIVLVVVAHRRIELLGERGAIGDRVAEHDARARQDDRELRLRQQLGRLRDRLRAAGRPLEIDDRRQVDVDHLRPVIARHVDLRRRRKALRLGDDAVEHLRDARGIAHLFLVADHVAEQRHLLDFLEAALPDGLVRRLRRDQQHRRVIPVGGLDGGHEVRDARAVLRDAHRDLAGRARVAVAYVAAVALVRDVPERDPGFWKKIGDRHECRADDAKGMLDAVHLQDFHEGFFRRHFHSYNPSSAALYINSRPVLKNSGKFFGGLPKRRQMPPRRLHVHAGLRRLDGERREQLAVPADHRHRHADDADEIFLAIE